MSYKQEITNNMDIDAGRFNIMVDMIYNYMDNGELFKMKHYIYQFSYYLEDLLANVRNPQIIYEFLSDYQKFSDKMYDSEQKLYSELYVKLNRDIIYDSDTDTYSITNLIVPMERQTNDQPPDEPQNPIIKAFKQNVLKVVHMQNHMALYTNIYIDELVQKRGKLKNEIIKYELTRLGNPLIHEMLMQCMELTTEIRKYSLMVDTIVCDASHDYSVLSQESHVKSIMYKYHRNLCTYHPYNLPVSVIKDCAGKPELWSKLCTVISPITRKIHVCPKFA